MKIILGSQSAGRKRVLEQMGYDFEIVPADIDEKAIRFSDPRELTLALARAKAQALLKKLTEPALLITSDLVVQWSDRILEKPAGPDQAREFLRGYATAPAKIVASVVITDISSGKHLEGVEEATVHFRPIPENVVETIVSDERTYTQGGGLSVEDERLKPYIERIDGEIEAIIGLPKKLTQQFLTEMTA